jgi:hypothetical protein
MHMAARRMVVPEYVHRPDDLHARRVLGHQDLRLLLARRRVRIGLHHHDHDLAAGIAEAGDVIFLPIDHPFVADEFCRRRDILGVRRCDIGFGHGVGGADFTVQQRLQPLLLLLAGADTLEHFHVAGIRRRTVHGFRGQRIFAELGCDIGIVEILQACSGLVIGQEEIPQADFLGLCLGFLQHLDLAGRKAPAIRLFLAVPVKLDRHRLDGFPDKLFHVVVKWPDLIRHAEVVEFIVRIETVGRYSGHVDVFHVFSSQSRGSFPAWRCACCRQSRRLLNLYKQTSRRVLMSVGWLLPPYEIS